MKKHIAIYQDYTHNNGSLFKALQSYFKQNSTVFFDADDIKQGTLNQDTKLFIMPGGASRYVADKLNGIGNTKIKEYVNQGGTYLGICAGAYYGCRRTKWQKGQKDEICVDNELGFFPGAARGPLNFAPPIDGKIAAAIPLTLTDGQTSRVLYWDGCLFEGVQPDEVIASYADGKPAVITGTYGKGRYILSGPHIEIDSKQIELMRFDVPNNRHAEIAALQETEGITTQLFTDILKRFVDSR